MHTLAVSNIAWSAEEGEKALGVLSRSGIRHLELAPTRLWKLAPSISSDEVRSALRPLQSAGFAVSGFQAILFGRPELALFDDAARPALLDYLKALAGVCSTAGGKYLVFGAPKNRVIPEGMDREFAFEIAAAFFRDLGSHAQQLGVKFGIEANPAAYGCNFCTHVAEAIRLVRAADSKAIRWHLDTGELAMNSENAAGVIAENADLLGSAHVSEPGLGDFSAPWSGHSEVAACLREAGYDGVVCLEMKRPGTGLLGLQGAVEFLAETYA